MRQIWEALASLFDDAGRAVTVLDVRGVRDKGKQVAVGIGQDMPLPPLCFLAYCRQAMQSIAERGIVSARPTAFGCFHRLAVDDPSSWDRVPAGQHAGRSDQCFVQNVQKAAVAQPVEIVLNRREGREILGRHRPLAPGRGVIVKSGV